MFVMGLAATGIFSSLVSIGHSADWWVAQTATGSASGADTNDLMSIASVNASFPASPGDWLHLCGIITNSLILGSGTTGHPITIHFEPNAKFSAPTLPTAGTQGGGWLCLGDHVVIDGGFNGRMELTDNGTPAAYGGTFDYNNGSVWGIYGDGHTDVTIQNLTIAGLYVRQTTNDPGPINNQNEVRAIFTRDTSGLTVTNCFIADVQTALFLTYNASHQSNTLCSHCVFTNYNWGLSMAADSDNGMLDNLTIANNFFYTGDAWEGNSDFHRNSIYLRDDIVTGGRMSNVVVACNFIKAGANPRSTAGGTSGFSFSVNSTNAVQHLRIYNNIAMMQPPLVYSAGGGPQLESVGVDTLLANNTVIGWATAVPGKFGGSGINSTFNSPAALAQDFVYNNLVVSGFGEMVNFNVSAAGLTNNPATLNALMSGINSDYNIFDCQASSSFAIAAYATAGGLWWEPIVDSFWAFTNAFPVLEPHSSSAKAQLAANYAPLSTDTVALGRGTNLTAFAIADNLPGLLYDYAGAPRPASGNWTIGAYQNPSPNAQALSLIAQGLGSQSSNPSGVPGLDITNGMILQYKFGDGSGIRAMDSSGQGNTGTLQGYAAWTNGVNGSAGAAAFPSNDGVFASPDGVVSAITYQGDWTISFWAYNNSFPGLYNYAASTAPFTGILVNYNNEITAWGFGDGTYFLNGSTPLYTQQWYFIAVSKSSGTNYQLYLNGNADNSGSLGNVNISSLTVGNRGGGILGMNGRVEDFRIFNRVLSGGEIATLNANGADAIAATNNAIAATNNALITVTPASLNFGVVQVGGTTNQTVMVQNSGGGTLTGSVSLGVPFSIGSGGTYSLAAGQSQVVSISYTPVASVTSTQTASFSGGAGASVSLTAKALPAPPQQLRFNQLGQ